MGYNFEFLAKYWPDMAQIGRAAELYVGVDAAACAHKLLMLAERVAQEASAAEHITLPAEATLESHVRALRDAARLPERIGALFDGLLDAQRAPVCEAQLPQWMENVFALCCWLMEVYGDWEFDEPCFRMPEGAPDGAERMTLLQEQEERIRALMAAAGKHVTMAEMSSAQEVACGEVMNFADAACDEDAPAPVCVELSVMPVINYAICQNKAVVIHSVRVENLTSEVIRDVELCITASPAFAFAYNRHIDYLPAGKSVTITNPEIVLNATHLAEMTEKITGTFYVDVKCEERVLASTHTQVEVLAFDEWHGIGKYPEYLASFVMPNHPDLAQIILRAAEHLGEWTGDSSLDAYQSQDPNRVLSQAGAIYTAIKEHGICYAVSPASFEEAGQRVRLCDSVLRQRMGNCLELSLLYAACLESVGLHPLLVSTEGHLFVGVWLENRMFPESVQDDFSLITKRLASGVNEIAVVETTCATVGRDLSFDSARACAEQNLATQKPECIIDVQRARKSGVLPLPLRVHTALGWEIVQPSGEEASAPTCLGRTIHVDPGAQEETLPKKAQWERKLLDLGMRNTLINLRITRTQVPLLTSSLDELENALTSGSDFTVLPKPGDLHVDELSFEALQELGDSAIIRAEFENKRLRSILTETELIKSIKGLYRTAKAALEENGANTLYLALGMLRWYETRRSTRARYAPIMLVPIDIVCKSAAQGYVIRLREEEPHMNITLLEKLKQDFDITVRGLDPLPTDGNGIDIRRVLTVVRKAVMDEPRWDVLESASIGIFSFSQFVMWNDIRNRTDDLMNNKIVRSLIDGKLCFEAEPMEIGDRISEDNVLLPLPADASQLYAIGAACDGQSFVLHGPPGTGKSQTITSLIANALAKGKSVLFVAEKMAALEVVQKRLQGIGIGPFCLELHSNKSKKRDVLEQLRRATEVTKTRSAASYAERAEQLAAMRRELDGYAEQLHRVLGCGKDLYTLINEYEDYKSAPDMTSFARTFVQSLTRSDLETQELAIERMITAAAEVKHPCGHPLSRVGRAQYKQGLKAEVVSAANAYIAQLLPLTAHVECLAKVLGEAMPTCYAEVERFTEIASYMTCWYDMPTAWAKTAAPAFYFGEIETLCATAIRANEQEEKLLACFDRAFLEKDGQALFEEYAQISAKWFLPKALGMSKLRKTLAAYAKAPVKKESVREHIALLAEYQLNRSSANALIEKHGAELGALYSGHETDWARVAALAAIAKEHARELYVIFGSYDVMNAHCGKAELRDAVCALADGLADFDRAKLALEELLGIAQNECENWLCAEFLLCRALLDHADELKEWMAYVGAADEVRALGLESVVDCYANDMAHGDVMRAYKKAMLQGLITDALDASGTLCSFSGAVFNKKIEQYKRMDREWMKLSQQEIYCRLASRVPDFSREAASSSELGILQRYIRSAGRGVSIRRLFDQIPNLLPRLCPCMLMSPISAAQYLDPKREPFDIVVFDEASQLPTCKAVGALARGRDAVIVGDPKQMPPTSFFATNTVDEDNLDIEDLESILDDCLALNMPQSHLLWHYRSRHESLIAFSNGQFYENKLYTFPSVNDRESKVKLVHVDGTFDRGKSRTNKAEAQAVVAEIKRRYSDPVLSAQSLGVVTFNISQQHLIDDLLTEAYAKDEALERWAIEREEPLFVKNLENVQGDERDVILFSIGFGPDATGKVTMNFGPLNREGGWRRLNVAVSRARCEMTVFSTLRPEQLDLGRTNAQGVAALRSFLEYAQGGELACAEPDAAYDAQSCDGIARAICRALGAQGYATDLCVGRSEYRIDVGVIDPKCPDRYLLGIMLDGFAYGAAKTTRDREIAQTNVLSGLGWNIYRIWCMDWWDNCEKEIDRLLEKLKEVEAARSDVALEDGGEEFLLPCEESVSYERVFGNAPQYACAQLQREYVPAELFTEPWNAKSVGQKVQEVIAQEAPVSLSLLIRRVVQSYGITRAGSRIQTYMNTLLSELGYPVTEQGGMPFYWSEEQHPDAYVGYRVSGEDVHHRDVRDVPVQEIANAVYTVLYEQIGMAEEDLLRETAGKLGYARLGSNVYAALSLGIAYAKERGGIEADAGGKWILTEEGARLALATLHSF